MAKVERTPEIFAWYAIHARCYNLLNPRYSDYGGRGIKVASEWFSYATFLADMGRRPTFSHSLERKDNNGPYSKENCIWATVSQQNLNRCLEVRNKTGITGVCFATKRNVWLTQVPSAPKKQICIYRGPDFFEACCKRKSWENQNKEY